MTPERLLKCLQSYTDKSERFTPNDYHRRSCLENKFEALRCHQKL